MIWIILVSVLIFIVTCVILFILLGSVNATVEYDLDLKIKLKILCFKFTIFDSSKNDNEPESKPEKTKNSKMKTIAKKLKRKDALDSLKAASKMLRTSTEIMKEFLEIINIDDLVLKLWVGGSDAADAAIRYGQACSIVYSAVGYVSSVKPLKKYDVSIAPNFTSEKTNFKFRLSITVKILKVLKMKSLAKLKNLSL